jgi:transcriptional regulator with XRE-family HTH domain
MSKKRQVDLAKESGMLQSAISRIEQADYGNWSLKTLFRVADALDARLRIDFDPIETVIEQYREKESEINQNEFPLELSETIVTCNDVARESFLETADNQNLNDRLTHANYI